MARAARLGEHQSIGKTLDLAGYAGMGFVILFLSLPALVPIPGPFGMVFGTALAIVAIQITLGRSSLWLPSKLRRRVLPPSLFLMLLRNAFSVLRKSKRVARANRAPSMTEGSLHALLGLIVLAMAILIILPIPFGNFLPVISLVILAISLIKKDGVLLVIGMFASLLTLTATGALLYGVFAYFAGGQSL